MDKAKWFKLQCTEVGKHVVRVLGPGNHSIDQFLVKWLIKLIML